MNTPLIGVEVGRGELLRGESDDEFEIGIIGIGHIVEPALQAADVLIGEGRRVAVVNARFVKPLDEKLILDVARRCKTLITVEENLAQGGFGSAVLELLARERVLVPVTIIGVPDEFIHHAHPKIQRRELGLDCDGLLYSMRRQLAEIKTDKPRMSAKA